MIIWILLVLIGGGSWVLMLYVERRKTVNMSVEITKSSSGKTPKIALKVNPKVNSKIQSPAILPYLDYNHYSLSLKEKTLAILMLALPAFLIGYIFYQNIILASGLASIGFLFPRVRQRQLIQKRKNMLFVQFKQALSCLSSSMTVGKSIETAFRETWEDLQLLYPDPACFIVVEFGMIWRKVENGEPIEVALKDFADRSHIEDIQSFTDVFLTCKRTGGNLVEVMKRTATVIAEKLEITQEISVMIAQKRFESRVLVVAPIAIVAVLAFSSPDYMEPLYRGSGILIMTVCLLSLGACYAITQKIMNIKV